MAVYKTSNSGLLTRREYTSFLAGNNMFVPNYTAGAYDSIATTTLATTTATVTFSSIPANYTHLQIRCLTRSTEVANGDNIYMQLNGSSASSYAWHRSIGSGAAPSAGTNSAVTLGLISINAGSTATAGTFGAAVIDILDYKDTNKNRTVRAIGGYDGNGHGYAAYQSFGYFNTTAITSITLGTSASFAQNSTFALYGIKGE